MSNIEQMVNQLDDIFRSKIHEGAQRLRVNGREYEVTAAKVSPLNVVQVSVTESGFENEAYLPSMLHFDVRTSDGLEIAFVAAALEIVYESSVQVIEAWTEQGLASRGLL